VPGRTADTSFIAGAATVVALAFAVVLAAMPVARDAGSAGFSPQLHRGAVKDLKAGRLIVASRNLPDPNFAATVILLAEYGKDGAMGLIVNRRTDVTLARIFPDLQSPESGATAFFGGPVSVSGVLALLRSASARADSRHVVGDVYLVNTGEVLKKTMAAGEGPRRFRVYVGYSGWGPGQLEHETNDGSWFVLDGDADVVFDPDPESIWRRQIKRAEALSASARPAPIHAPPDALLVETGGVSGRGAPPSP
jgi:putative transcriptional regulator